MNPEAKATDIILWISPLVSTTACFIRIHGGLHTDLYIWIYDSSAIESIYMRAQLEPYGCGTVSLHWECSKLFANTPQTSGNRTRTKCLSNWYITQAQDHHIHGQCTIQTRTLDFHCISLTIQVDPIPQGAKWWVAPRKSIIRVVPPPQVHAEMLIKSPPQEGVMNMLCIYIYICLCVCVFVGVCLCMFPSFPGGLPRNSEATPPPAVLRLRIS